MKNIPLGRFEINPVKAAGWTLAGVTLLGAVGCGGAEGGNATPGTSPSASARATERPDLDANGQPFCDNSAEHRAVPIKGAGGKLLVRLTTVCTSGGPYIGAYKPSGKLHQTEGQPFGRIDEDTKLPVDCYRKGGQWVQNSKAPHPVDVNGGPVGESTNYGSSDWIRLTVPEDTTVTRPGGAGTFTTEDAAKIVVPASLTNFVAYDTPGMTIKPC